ncbi:hypothetical protein MAPG_12110 [Magnaporthiopsis poae ATCC 64411]|uniref:Uncharacterized protein n=1 Tax=Magnaporthiopsis poae (strain ATCC 64411 / 73-15) TaxID=644358 RepID=A0A0C4EGV3_MAGP6|nr:hypothetical protein MAPG_12110 [Magnaporthiopsis poae ATCC 64411]
MRRRNIPLLYPPTLSLLLPNSDPLSEPRPYLDFGLASFFSPDPLPSLLLSTLPFLASTGGPRADMHVAISASVSVGCKPLGTCRGSGAEYGVILSPESTARDEWNPRVTLYCPSLSSLQRVQIDDTAYR